MRLFHLLLILGTSALMFQSTLRAQSGSGIDCECDAVGGYLDPDIGSAPDVNPDSTSPNGLYRLEISEVSPTVYLVVRRVSNSEIVYSTSLDINSQPWWGFSPDDDRFVYQYTLSDVHHVTLIDLSVSPGQQRWTTSVATGASRVRFSASGRWLLYAALTSTTHTALFVIETNTGATAYESEFDFQPVADPSEEWGMVDWGFSTDSLDRSFVYAFVSGASSVEWFVVNLEKRSTVRDATLTGISAFWQFSPCGDMIGLALQTQPTVIEAQLYRTSGSQAPVASQTLSLGDPVAFRSTSASHIVAVGGVDHVLASNNADAICKVAPVSIVIAPDSVYGRAGADGYIGLNAPAPAGGLVVSLASSNPAAASVPPSVTFLEGSSEQTFALTTELVTQVEDVTIEATGNGQTIEGTITVLPIVPEFVKNPDTVVSGGALTVGLSLPVPAPAGGITYRFETSDTTILHFTPGGDSVRVEEYGTQGQLALAAAAVDRDTAIEIRVRDYPAASICLVLVRAARVARVGTATNTGGCYISTMVRVTGDANDQDEVQNWLDTPAGPVYYTPGSSIGLSYALAGSTGPSGAALSLSSSDPAFLPDTVVWIAPLEDSVTVVLLPLAQASGADSVVITSTLNGESLDYVFRFRESPDFAVQELTVGGIPCDSVLDINELEHILGYWEGEPCLLRNGALVRLDSTLAGYRLTTPVAINDLDWVVGQVGDTAAVYDGDTTRTAPLVLGGGYYNGVSAVASIATAINNLGDITGRLIDTVKSGSRGFAWFNVAAYLQPFQEIWFSADSVVPTSINDNRWVVGSFGLTESAGQSWNCPDCRSSFWLAYMGSYPYSGRGDYCICDPEFGDADIPVYFDTPVMVTNDRRVLAGRWRGLFLTYAETGPFSFNDTLTLHSLPPPAGYGDPRDVIWFDINEQDDVAGRVGQHGVVVIDRMVYNLNCSQNLPPGTVLLEARGITDKRRIVANGTSGGVARGFILGDVSVAVEDGSSPWRGVPEAHTLNQNYPNPFNPSTTIEYRLGSPAQVAIEIFNVLGRKVRGLVNDFKPAGDHRAVWDGQDDQGRPVASGIYLYRLRAGDSVTTRKMLLMK